MICQNFQQQLDDYVDGALDAQSAQACQLHIADCVECRQIAEQEMLLRQQLRMLSVEPPNAGYEARMLDAIRESAPANSSHSQLIGFAMAASVMFAVVFSLFNGFGGQDLQSTEQVATIKIINMQAGSEQPVKLVFNAPNELRNVELKIELPEGVEYVNNPSLRVLAWHADLKPGMNVLELPVRMVGSGGVLLASLTYGGQKRELSVRIQAALESRGSSAWNAVQVAKSNDSWTKKGSINHA